MFLARRRAVLGPSRLTARELEVLQLAAQGLAGEEIASRLLLSRSTVKTHFEHIYAKLGVSNRVAAVATALRAGLIE
jgi:DNA-binding CsgD family transcriptional regulator